MNAGELFEARLSSLGTRLRSYWEDAMVQEVQSWYEAPRLRKDEQGILEVVEPFLICEGQVKIGKESAYGTKPCKRRAGQATGHDGVGLCAYCGGRSGKGEAIGAILMAMAYADELNISPWEALLQQVRLLANQVAWLRGQVAMREVIGGAEVLLPGGSAYEIVEMLERRGERLAKVSKMAIDAGVAERFIRQLDLEADLMVKAAMATFRDMGLDEDASTKALAFMSTQLQALEAAQTPWPDRENA